MDLSKYDCAKFPVKSMLLSGFRQGALCAPPWGMMREKYPGTAKVKGVLSYKDSRCNSSFNFMLEVPLVIPLIAKGTLY